MEDWILNAHKMSRAEFAQYAKPLPDRKDWMKAWLKDNEYVPKRKLQQGIHQVPWGTQSDNYLLVYANHPGKVVGIVAVYAPDKRIDHIVVNDEFKGLGIATRLLAAARERGCKTIEAHISPEAAGLCHRFLVETALLDGHFVPMPIVWNEYPDLKPLVLPFNIGDKVSVAANPENNPYWTGEGTIAAVLWQKDKRVTYRVELTTPAPYATEPGGIIDVSEQQIESSVSFMRPFVPPMPENDQQET